jgi:hypothetical protein
MDVVPKESILVALATIFRRDKWSSFERKHNWEWWTENDAEGVGYDLEFFLPGRDAVSSVENQQTYRRNISPQMSGSENNVSKKATHTATTWELSATCTSALEMMMEYMEVGVSQNLSTSGDNKNVFCPS